MFVVRNLIRSQRGTSNVAKYSSLVIPNENVANSEPSVDKLYKILEIELRGNDPAVLKSFSKYAVATGTHFEIQTKAWTQRKPEHERYTVLKSVHVNKKHRVQYEHRTYYSFLQYHKLTGSTANTLLEYIERNLPEGVSLKATKVELQRMPEHLKSPT